MTAAAVTPAGARVARGIGFALVSYACFSTSDATIKLASARFSVFEIAFTLPLAALLPVMALARGQGGLRALLPTRWPLVLARGALSSACALVCWKAFALLPLADSYAILFASPMLVTALSVPLLGESVGWRRWGATVVGFAGVLLMIRPGFAAVGTGHLLAVLGALLGAVSFCILRRIGRSERSAPIMAVLFACLALETAPLALRDLVVPTAPELALLVLAGLLQGAGQAALVLATRDAPAAIVAPFQYSQMLWAVLFGALLFGDRPDPMLFLGLTVVAGSGLYTLWRETVRHRPVTLATCGGEAPARAAR